MEFRILQAMLLWRKIKKMKKIIDLSLNNSVLYKGCVVEEVAGRKNLATSVAEAVNIVGKNIAEMVQLDTNRDELVLTGPMAVWAYLVVFHATVHSYRRVSYDDGRSGEVLVAAHG